LAWKKSGQVAKEPRNVGCNKVTGDMPYLGVSSRKPAYIMAIYPRVYG